MDFVILKNKKIKLGKTSFLFFQLRKKKNEKL